jgi:hypothetical protein
MDGTTSDVPDTQRTPRTSAGRAAPPGRGIPAGPPACRGRVRDRGADRGHVQGPYTLGEQTLARGLLPAFGPQMLVLADRNFLSHTLARDVHAAGAHLLWRTSASSALTPTEVLADGSFLAQQHPARRTTDGPPIMVRVIEHTVNTTRRDGDEQPSELICRVTDLLDVEAYPALDLAYAYPCRWSAETVIGHHNRHGRGHARTAQQRSPGRGPGDVGAVRGLPGHPHPDHGRDHGQPDRSPQVGDELGDGDVLRCPQADG